MCDEWVVEIAVMFVKIERDKSSDNIKREEPGWDS